MARRTRDNGDTAPRQVPVRMQEESAPERWLRTLRVSGFSVIALVLLGLAVVVLAPSLRLLVEQQQQITALERSVEDQRAHVEDVRAELGRWSDPAYIEAQARQRLLFIYPGEYSYIVTNGPGEPEVPLDAGLPVSSELQATRVDWVAALLASGYGAGLTDATGDELAVVGAPLPAGTEAAG
ncbi:MAG TPA: septum formation initiator family protein [Microbacteriaceae bacterium]|nr:septum formation initiator family protein [Microbacteriaceae bacterium]